MKKICRCPRCEVINDGKKCMVCSYVYEKSGLDMMTEQNDSNTDPVMYYSFGNQDQYIENHSKNQQYAKHETRQVTGQSGVHNQNTSEKINEMDTVYIIEQDAGKEYIDKKTSDSRRKVSKKMRIVLAMIVISVFLAGITAGFIVGIKGGLSKLYSVISDDELDKKYGINVRSDSFDGSKEQLPDDSWIYASGWISSETVDMDNDGVDEQIVFYLKKSKNSNNETSSGIYVDVYSNKELMTSKMLMPPVENILEKDQSVNFSAYLNKIKDNKMAISTQYTYWSEENSVQYYEYYKYDNQSLDIELSIMENDGVVKYIYGTDLLNEPDQIAMASEMEQTGSMQTYCKNMNKLMETFGAKFDYEIYDSMSYGYTYLGSNYMQMLDSGVHIQNSEVSTYLIGEHCDVSYIYDESGDSYEEDENTEKKVTIDEINRTYGSYIGDNQYDGGLENLPDDSWIFYTGWISNLYEDMDGDGIDEQLVFYLKRSDDISDEDSSSVWVDVYCEKELTATCELVPSLGGIIKNPNDLIYEIYINKAENGKKVICINYYSSVKDEYYSNTWGYEYYAYNATGWELLFSVVGNDSFYGYKYSHTHSLIQNPDLVQKASDIVESQEDKNWDKIEAAVNEKLKAYGSDIAYPIKNGEYVECRLSNYKEILSGSFTMDEDDNILLCLYNICDEVVYED